MRERGQVKWFSVERGYGFIVRENGSEVFVHHSDIEADGFRSLRAGEIVEFEVVDEERGPRARRVTRGSAPEARRERGGTEPDPTEAAARVTGDQGGAAERGGGEERESLEAQLRRKLGRFLRR